jgi:parallel beta helix pectate lyase-like protein/ASPM-SPD-2-Hydin domain-containing protein
MDSLDRRVTEGDSHVKRLYWSLLGSALILVGSPFSPRASANILQVGPGKPYATPCAAIAVAAAGDTIQIDSSGNYAGDVCAWSTNGLTLMGVGTGRAVLNAAGQNSQGKGIWVISGNNTVVENIEFTGATVTDMNGAGIRAQGSNLTIRNCYFHDNQEGILTDGGTSTILIEFSEFYHNGAGDGFSHNLYIGNITQFIFRYNYSHGAIIGHQLKSRAAENDIYYNRFSDETTGTASYEIDLPNGGLSYVVGNLIEKGPQAQNSALVTYQEEGADAGNPDHEFFVINNTMVNDYGQGTFIVVDSSVSVPAVIKNNIFQGSGTVTSQAAAVKANNFAGDAKLVSPITYDYHLQSGSPAIDAGADLGRGAGVALVPVFQYVHPACAEQRITTGTTIDIGAYEFNGSTGVAPPNAPSTCGASSTPAPAASLSPSSLTFAGQTTGTTSPGQNVALTNTGTASLTISGISINGPNSTDYSQTNMCGPSLVAGGNCIISITFTPRASGARSAVLSISDNAPGSPQTVAFSGTGVATAPVATLSPNSLTFAAQPPGSASASQPVTLTNSGTASLSISAVSASGDFGQTNNCGATLATGVQCTVNVTFSPCTGGTRTGTLSVSDNASGTPQTAALTGTGSGGAPSASISPGILTFAGQLVGAPGAAQQLKLANGGTAALTVSGISASGDFTQANTCGSSLATGANCTITVSFKPTAGGARTGTLTVSDNSSPSSQSVGLSGTGMDFSLSTGNGSTTLNAGQTANASLAITPDGGLNQQITLSCSGAPKDSVCSLKPSSVILDGISVASVSVSFTTTARSWMLPITRFIPFAPAVQFLVFLVVIIVALMFSPRRFSRLAFSYCCILLAVCFGSGCLGVVSKVSPPQPGGIGTPAGSYILALTGTSGSLSHSTSITLKVN